MKRSRPRPSHLDRDLLYQFEVFYRINFVPVSRYVARRLPTESRDEVVATVFVVAWKKFAGVESPSLPWLYRIASFEVSHERRRLGRVPQMVALFDVVPTDNFPLEDVMDTSTAFAHLNEGDQELLRLLYWEELGRTEIAEVLNCSVNTLNVRVHRALERLRGEMSRVTVSNNFPNHTEELKEES